MDPKALRGRVADRDPSDSPELVATVDRIQRVRELAAKESAPDLVGCVDAAFILTRSLAHGGSSDQEDIIKAVSGLVDVVVEARASLRDDLH